MGSTVDAVLTSLLWSLTLQCLLLATTVRPSSVLHPLTLGLKSRRRLLLHEIFCRVELIIFSPFVCLYRRIIQWDIKAADAILVCSLRNESGNTEEVAGVSALRRQRDN